MLTQEELWEMTDEEICKMIDESPFILYNPWKKEKRILEALFAGLDVGFSIRQGFNRELHITISNPTPFSQMEDWEDVSRTVVYSY